MTKIILKPQLEIQGDISLQDAIEHRIKRNKITTAPTGILPTSWQEFLPAWHTAKLACVPKADSLNWTADKDHFTLTQN